MDNLIVDLKRMRNEAIVAIVAQVEGPIFRLGRAVAFQVCSVHVWACSGDSLGFRKHFFITKSSQVISLKAMKTYSGSKVIIFSFLNSALDGISGLHHAPTALSVGRNPGTH